ncbi:hypothetical protein MXB_1570 [Myxobolus squamalis]|nr:hypothetical protein MXB_1570 [Myxobolus squamalis]
MYQEMNNQNKEDGECNSGDEFLKTFGCIFNTSATKVSAMECNFAKQVEPKIIDNCNRKIKKRVRVAVSCYPSAPDNTGENAVFAHANTLTKVHTQDKKVRKLKKRGGKKRKTRKIPQEKRIIKQIVPTCKFYLEGRCNKGVECEFRHEGEIIKKREPCKFFLRDGHCLKGVNCAYMHAEFPCKFHYWGTCKQTQSCRFSHDLLTDETKTILELHITKTAAESRISDVKNDSLLNEIRVIN